MPSAPASVGGWRPLSEVLAARSRRHPDRRSLVLAVLRSLALTLLVALAAAPFALAWAVGHARVEDYLGPHRVSVAANFRSEVQVDLGPLGNAYLRSPLLDGRSSPVGLTLTVHGVGAVEGQTSFLSAQTLAAYAAVYAEPQESVAGLVDRLRDDVVVTALRAELVLLGVLGLWGLRHALGPSPRPVSGRRALVVYLTAGALVFGSLAAPPPPGSGVRLPVSVDLGPSVSGLTVDSALLADLLDRGVRGVRLLSERQRRVVDAYVATAQAGLDSQYAELPRRRADETMLLGFSDLHCNRAMTELLRRLVELTRPAQVLDSGDDTVNGTAAERFCVTGEAGIAGGRPFAVASGNHDSDVTETQQRATDAITVLDGSVVEAGGLTVLGDDDPEHNLPFSVERDQDRAETEEQLGRRLLDTARGRPVDVLLVHQPAASVVVMTAPDPPARLVLWGHFHSQQGPTVVTHQDGSWTVGMQQGTAGGVRQPTLASFSTPFSPPLISADAYFYFRDNATGLVTGVQPVHFLPSGRVLVEARTATGDLAALPPATRDRLRGSTPSPAPAPR